MTMWLNGKRKPGPKYKRILIETFGEQAVIAFGEDPDLWAIREAWHNLSPMERTSFRYKIVKKARQNFEQMHHV